MYANDLLSSARLRNDRVTVAAFSGGGESALLSHALSDRRGIAGSGRYVGGLGNQCWLVVDAWCSRASGFFGIHHLVGSGKSTRPEHPPSHCPVFTDTPGISIAGNQPDTSS